MAATAAAASTQVRLQWLALLEGELKMPGQEMMRKSEVDPGDSGSARG